MLTSAHAQPKSAKEKTFHLKYSGFMPQGQQMEATVEWWSKEVEKRTDGRVKVDLYFAQTLGKQQDFPKMVKGGVCDISIFGGGFREFPVINIFGGPFVIPNRATGWDVFWTLYYNGLLKELDDYKVLWAQPSDIYYMLLRDKKVTKMEEFKGMKLRGLPGLKADFNEALGATTVAMLPGELFMSLDRGILDGLTTTWEYAKIAKLHEVTKYWIWEPLCTGLLLIGMNRNVWTSLPTDIQAIMLELNAQAKYHFMKGFETPAETRAIIKKTGWEVYELSSGERMRWREAAQQVVDKWSAEMVSRGLPGPQVLDTIKHVLELYE